MNLATPKRWAFQFHLRNGVSFNETAAFLHMMKFRVKPYFGSRAVDQEPDWPNTFE
jgi:hypothetical protein